ncbi:MAG: AMP-binding protein, partial [Desulfobacterales bacterium]
MNIWMTLGKALDLYPDKIGVVDGDRSYTYRQVGERVAGLARYFQKQKIQPEDRISVLEVNSNAYLEIYYAAAGIGAILNPLNYRLAAREIAFILNDADSRWLIAATRFADVVKGVLKEGVPLEGIVWIGDPPNASFPLQCHSLEDAISSGIGYFEPVSVDENQVAQLYYTSGTTGRPKGVMLTHKNVCSHALGT